MATAGPAGASGEWSVRAIAEWLLFAAIWIVILWGIIERTIRRLRRRPH